MPAMQESERGSMFLLSTTKISTVLPISPSLGEPRGTFKSSTRLGELAALALAVLQLWE
jgi:hypothetical protein